MRKVCIHDSKMENSIVEKLKDMGFTLVSTIDLKVTKSALDTHPDIQICKIDSNTIVVEPSLYDYYKKSLSKYGIIVIKGESKVSFSYPYDSLYNAAVGNKMIICNRKSTDEAVIKACMDLDYIEVKQGYTKCNVLFTRNGVISSDMGIYKSLSGNKLLISPGFIKLNGFNYGFIGGASGYLDNVVYFTGDIKTHPDYFKIKQFLDLENTEITSLNKGDLVDYGSLIFLEGD